MRTLFSKFSAVGGFEGWMIAKLNFKRLLAGSGRVSKENSEAVILSQRARYAIFQAEDANWQVQMHLIKPKEQKKEITSKEGQKKNWDKEMKFSKEIAKWKINKEEILEFVTLVEDLNSIHRTEHAVVPGFLFIERMWNNAKVAECIKEWKEFEVIFSVLLMKRKRLLCYKRKKWEIFLQLQDGRRNRFFYGSVEFCNS